MAKRVKKSFIAYKKAHTVKKYPTYAGERVHVDPRPVLITLRIPRGAHINLSPTGSNFLNGDKNRASSAKVISIQRIIKTKRVHSWSSTEDHDYTVGKHKHKAALSMYDPTYRYQVGKTMKPVHRFSHRMIDCASGIHFFCDAETAMKYGG